MAPPSFETEKMTAYLHPADLRKIEEEARLRKVPRAQVLREIVRDHWAGLESTKERIES